MSTRARIQLVCALLAALVVVGGGAWYVRTRSSAAPAAAATTDGAQPIPARPAPKTPPKPVVAGGACGVAMARIRGIQRVFPSGALLTDAANAALTGELRTLDRACAATPALAREFRRREVTPWLTYLPPVTAGS